MGVRNVISRLLLGVALTGVAALLVFVGVPWLTAQAPEPLVLSPEEIVEQALGRQAGQGSKRMEGMLLREEAPEHPVTSLTAAASEKADGQAEAGELPAALSADQVPGAMSEFVRVASAPEVDWEEDDRGSDKDVERVELDSEEVTEEREPEVATTPEREAASVGDPVGSMPAGEETAAEVVEVPESDAAARDEEPAVAVVGALAAGGDPGFSPVDGAAAMQEGPRVPLGETGSQELGIELTAEDGRLPEDAPLTVEDAIPSGETRQKRAHEAGQVGNPRPGLTPLREGVVVPHSLRGVMGYRLPLVSRQEVPDQVVSGVLIPGHTTYVILRKGEWELVGLSAEEIELLRQAAEKTQEEGIGEDPEESESRGWRVFDLFRRKDRGGVR